MDILQQVPDWLLRPLPTNADGTVEPQLLTRIEQAAKELPQSIARLSTALSSVRDFCEYDAAANVASAYVWLAQDQFYAAESPKLRTALLAFAEAHMVEKAQGRIARRLAKDSTVAVRLKTRRTLIRLKLREVALPAKRDGTWDTSGWFKGTDIGPLTRHEQGKRIQKDHGVPIVANLGDLRKLLDIRSEKQLGYFLLATDASNGPYTKFTIPKRDGNEREICAPKKQLRWVQRKILDEILEKAAPHTAAHGFIKGRSIVTNAMPHRGAKLIVKFDLMEFFPTIHYYRVVGLFASLGYYVGSPRFHSKDDSEHVAPTLARLCCYTPDPSAWGQALTPQGAPTSPAISNLVCRRLDARLEGLASRNKGVYTRYADDLTFSFKEPDFELGRFRWWVNQICHQEGFFINERKFRVIRSSQRQVVTGIVVNDELRIPREDRRRFRAILHNCRKHGIESQARDNPKFTDYLRGFASYINMVHPEEGEALLKEVDDLLGTEREEEA